MFYDLTTASLVRDPSLIVRDLEHCTLLLGEDGVAHQLDGLTGRIFRMAAEPTTLDSIIDDVVASGIEAVDDKVLDAVFAVAAQLVGRGWLTISGPQGPVHRRVNANTVPGSPAHDATRDALPLEHLRGLIPAADLPPELWLRDLREQRIVRVADAVGQRFPDAVPSGIGDVLSGMVREQVTWSMVAERAGVRAAKALQAHDVPFVVLKGLASAQLDYPDPSWRELGDVDLLVRPGDVVRADAALASVAVPIDQVSAGLRLRNKERNFLTTSDVEIDLHHRLLEDPFGRAVSVESLFENTVDVVIGGVVMAALDAPHRLAHAVAHWATNQPSGRRSNGLADVVMMSRSDHVVRQARQVLADWSLGCLGDMVPDFPGSRVKDRHRLFGALNAQAAAGSRLAIELAAVMAAPGPAATFSELTGRLWPSEELMALHGVSHRTRLTRFTADRVRSLTHRRGQRH